MSLSYSINPANNQMQLNTSDFQYDNAGKLIQAPNPAGGSHALSYTAEGYLRCVDGCGLGSYLTDAIGQRSYESRPWYATWPVYFNGQVMAEFTDSGTTTDYIYANGQKIAKTASAKPIFTMHGVRDNSVNMSYGVEGPVSGAGGIGYTIQTGDRLLMLFRQTQPSYGGLVLWLTDGDAAVPTDAITGENFYDIDFTDGQWHAMSGDLSVHVGETIAYVQTGFHNKMPAGTFDINFADVVIQTSSGGVIPILTGQPATLNPYGTGGEYDQSAQTVIVATGSSSNTNYYLADHLGTTQLELSGGGWPVWQGQFTPFGQEIVNGGTTNAFGPQPSDGIAMHFKFTGKERDAESGLDYFGARYYASSMGRFMSPDWSASVAAVPYAQLWNPQTLNLYAYVGNNPLSRNDPDGHFWKELWNDIRYGEWTRDTAGAQMRSQQRQVAALRTFYQGLSYTPQNGSTVVISNLSDADLTQFNKDHRDEFAHANWAVSVGGAAAAGVGGSMLGANGTQVTSKTLWEAGDEHIDVENPNPGQRPGQIHYQDGDSKYIYDAGSGKFQGLSDSQSKQLMSKPEVQQAIDKGMKYLGEGK